MGAVVSTRMLGQGGGRRRAEQVHAGQGGSPARRARHGAMLQCRAALPNLDR